MHIYGTRADHVALYFGLLVDGTSEISGKKIFCVYKYLEKCKGSSPHVPLWQQDDAKYKDWVESKIMKAHEDKNRLMASVITDPSDMSQFPVL